MKEFIEFLAKHLVDNHESVVVEEKISNEDKVIYSLKVSKEDIGKVIGKQGKNAQALRTLITAAAAKQGKRAIIEILY